MHADPANTNCIFLRFVLFERETGLSRPGGCWLELVTLLAHKQLQHCPQRLGRPESSRCASQLEAKAK